MLKLIKTGNQSTNPPYRLKTVVQEIISSLQRDC